MTTTLPYYATNIEEKLEPAAAVMTRLRDRIRLAVKGRDEVLDLIIIALLADGHVLLEDYPGSGKTTIAKSLAGCIAEDPGNQYIAGFRRIQFTPDLLPSDITGVSVFHAGSGTFEFRRGPLFASVVLADEINRTSPKVQAAMLEAMAEKQVTVDDCSRPLDELFFVIATQNPREVAGTYPLPLAQLDRFLFKIRMDHIDRDSELAVLAGLGARQPDGLQAPCVTRDEILEARAAIRDGVFVPPEIHACLVDTARAIRGHAKVAQGISTRALVLMLPALQVSAAMAGRDFVSSEDVERLAPYVFCHRLELTSGAKDPAVIVRECLIGPMEKLTRSTLRGSQPC